MKIIIYYLTTDDLRVRLWTEVMSEYGQFEEFSIDEFNAFLVVAEKLGFTFVCKSED
jgi:hypothetical protein